MKNGTIAWTMKTKLKTTPAEDLRAMMFVDKRKKQKYKPLPYINGLG